MFLHLHRTNVAARLAVLIFFVPLLRVVADFEHDVAHMLAAASHYCLAMASLDCFLKVLKLTSENSQNPLSHPMYVCQI